MGREPVGVVLHNQEEVMTITPTIAETKQLAQKYGLRRCIVLFETDDGRPGYVSYGKTKALCDDTVPIADAMFDVLSEKLDQR